MAIERKQPKPKKCRVATCRASFVPSRMGQAVCSPACAMIDAPRHEPKARKALADIERKDIKVRKEKLKSRAEHLKDTQQAFNAWVRARDAALPCVSCGRHHGGQYHAGHYRTVGANPELRFEPLNAWKQCAPCNNHLSGNLINYRISLLQRIGEEKVAWLEGPHKAKKYTNEELKAMTAEYRAKTKELKKGKPHDLSQRCFSSSSRPCGRDHQFRRRLRLRAQGAVRQAKGGDRRQGGCLPD